MGRVSRAEALANRNRVLNAAARLFREKGVANVSVVDVMRTVNLTQGGFYKHFESKAALVDEAASTAFADMMEQLRALDAGSDGHSVALASLFDSYLSVEARDDPGGGCPAAGFAGDVAREPEWCGTYSSGVRDMADWIAPGETGLTVMTLLVGAIVLARATASDPLSEEILRVARTAVDRVVD